MTVTPTHCSRCGASTKPGLVIVYQDHRAKEACWVEGPVERTFLGGLRLRGRRKGAVSGQRCDSCGHLDLYVAAIE